MPSRAIQFEVLLAVALAWLAPPPAAQAQAQPGMSNAGVRAAGAASKAASAAQQPAADTLEGFCQRVEARLPQLPRGLCLAAGLHDSGARSVRGVPIWRREIAALPATAGGGETGVSPALKPAALGVGGALAAAAGPAKRVLLVGGIHGDELTSVDIVLRWLQRIGSEPEARAVHWKVVPLLNPDGFFASPASRINANGVDLNRNFPTPNWKTEAGRYWEVTVKKDPRRYPGPAPLSEPESRWLNEQLERFKPDVIISVHAPLGVLDFDGPPPPPQRIGRLYLDQVGIYPGSLGNYSGVHRGTPVVTLELPNALAMPSAFEQDRMWRDILLWIRRHIAARDGRGADTAGPARQVPAAPAGIGSGAPAPRLP